MEKNGEIKQKGHLYQMGHNPFRSFYAGIVSTAQGVSFCAADFSLLNLPKGKSLGRSKPATNS
jgi:hypothetical protein